MKKVLNKKTKNVFRNITLSFVSIILTLILLEAGIRIIRPDLEKLVNSKFVRHRHRIHANPPNTYYVRCHPDSFNLHWVIHNSLGNRQHREFPVQKTKSTIRIGFYGDSFTENINMAAQYSFTEPLDYLLNKTGNSYEILNFGTDGYGTDQIYLQYMDEGRKMDLDIVVYMYCRNDLMDIMADKLFDLDENGKAQYLPPSKPRLYITIVRKFYLTYFVLEKLAHLKNTDTNFFLQEKYEEWTEDKETERRDNLESTFFVASNIKN